jgi:hypothetical protein
VVNNARNRFTVVDYDNMFCPKPQLSMIHGHDDLFTSGPCVLGAAVNLVLGRDILTQIEEGEQTYETAKDNIPGRTVILEERRHDVSCCIHVTKLSLPVSHCQYIIHLYALFVYILM